MSYEVKSLNEECGIFGVWGYRDAASVAYFGLHSLQHRGQEGAGIVSNDRGKLMGHRDLGLLSEVFKDQRKLQQLTGRALNRTCTLCNSRQWKCGQYSAFSIQIS